MQKRPHKLPAYVFHAKFEMRVLVDRVMPAIEGGRANIESLLVRDFVGIDQARGIAGARGGDGRIERVQEGVTQSHPRRARFHQARVRSALKHARLCGHVGR